MKNNTQPNEAQSFEAKLNKGLAYVWLALAVCCLAGVIFAGAYWHLFTGGISFLMYLAMRSESDD